MPERKTAVNACGCLVKLDNEIGILCDISGSTNEATIKLERELGDYNTFNDDQTYYLECKESADVELTAIYTTEHNGSVDILAQWWEMKGARTIQIYIPQGVKGWHKWQGEAICESLEFPLKSDDAKPIMVKAALKMDGGIRRYLEA